MKNKELKTGFLVVLLNVILVGCQNGSSKEIIRNDNLKSNSNCTLTVDELLKKNINRVFVTDTFPNGKIAELRDKGRDSIEGGYYWFYNNGHLKSYKFFIDEKRYGYNEEYDQNGNLTKTEDIPIIYTWVRRINIDSFCIKMYFFAPNKNYKKVYAVTGDNRNITLTLKNDTLLYSSMKVAFLGYNGLKKEKDFNTYVNVEYEDECTHEAKAFQDTIALHYSPYWGLTKNGRQLGRVSN